MFLHPSHRKSNNIHETRRNTMREPVATLIRLDERIRGELAKLSPLNEEDFSRGVRKACETIQGWIHGLIDNETATPEPSPYEEPES